MPHLPLLFYMYSVLGIVKNFSGKWGPGFLCGYVEQESEGLLSHSVPPHSRGAGRGGFGPHPLSLSSFLPTITFDLDPLSSSCFISEFLIATGIDYGQFKQKRICWKGMGSSQSIGGWRVSLGGAPGLGYGMQILRDIHEAPLRWRESSVSLQQIGPQISLPLTQNPVDSR